MSTSSDAGGRWAVVTGTVLLAIAAAGLITGLVGDASAGVAPTAARGAAPAAGRLGGADGAPAAATGGDAARASGRAGAWMQLRCWQHGRLLFDEGPVRLAADARLGARLLAERRDGGSLVVTEAGSTTCLARPVAAPPSLALPR